ncbi:Uma2 family endonuclease [Cronbergia sp. UHCC 0137]|uniref:Uma2 family endonuclease n=1 Tax=Cronbergia sp. UHCC 0137 TaxID=3110239 RepID=UPI002B22091C|nr:Uma2 family endonuclease [Cronbergia sp. UHCC 0137]MEA5620792.1 Uma2 family endonuclease [Cronbergia sp. UHCC 0137]
MITTNIPPLENGDRLNRLQFEQRYALMPPQKKAELVNGVVYMAAALRYRSHGLPHSYIMTWLGVYAANTPGVELADNTTVRLDLDNEPQPDALLRIKSEFGGQSRISEDDYVEGSPELIVEIAGSTVSYDLYDKLTVYRRHGVKEYIVWRVYDQQIDWFYLEQGKYINVPVNDLGLIESRVFPGLVLSIDHLLKNNLAQVLSTLQIQLNTGKHQNYCQELKYIRGNNS